jgi:predicted nucleic acid-binding protein
MRAAADPTFIASLNRQVDADLFATSIEVLERCFGVERLPEGRRKADLRDVRDVSPSHLVVPLVLTFDTAAAMVARIAGEAERDDPTIGQADAQIAAIINAYGYARASRNLASLTPSPLIPAGSHRPIRAPGRRRSRQGRCGPHP